MHALVSLAEVVNIGGWASPQSVTRPSACVRLVCKGQWSAYTGFWYFQRLYSQNQSCGAERICCSTAST
jgi:hypothetical protein